MAAHVARALAGLDEPASWGLRPADPEPPKPERLRSLFDSLRQVPEFRSARGVRRSLASVLAIATAARLAVARNGAGVEELPKAIRTLVPSKLPNKRCLRYATPGLHEYRGKFFPQLVRALVNIARLPEDAVILDPMCGSGMTLVEARLSGRMGYGLDMNLLSVFVTDVKCRALSLRPATLTRACEDLRRTLTAPASPRGQQ